MMHKKFLIYLVFLLLPLFPSGCQKELEGPQETGTPEEGVWTKVHYRATVSGSPETKATLDAIDRHYLFERDDLLYIVDKAHENDRTNAELYGFLYLISGADATTAVFEGDLMYFVEKSSGVYEPERPEDNLAITATLVSKKQRDDRVYTIVAENAGKIATGPNFGDNYAATFKDAVQKYSTFKADATYGDPSFSLIQGTAFLLVSLSFDDFITSSTPLSITIANNYGTDTPFFSHDISSDDYHQASFVAAFPGETITLSNARLTVTDGSNFTSTKSLSDATLHANEYYNISRTLLDLSCFTIQAEANTTIEFPTYYQDAAYELQYYHEGAWKNVSSNPSVTLVAGESVKVRGKGLKYKYDDAGSALFSSSAACLIYGDIMSLFCSGASYDKPTAFTAANNNALDGTFKGMTNLDIHPARALLLSATTLAEDCYRQMFSGSSITHAPEFFSDAGDYAADIPAQACYQMFQGCTALTAAPELPANGTIGTEGYRGMFSGCTAMATPPSRLAVTPAGESNSNFREMFQGCTSLLSAPELPATAVNASGCRAMFSGCTALTAAPALPAETVADYAYYYMFENCSSMTTGPASLPALTMNDYCYAYMFTGSKLGEAPVISATTADVYCFYGMFSGCSNLTKMKDDAALNITGIPDHSCDQMFYNCVKLNKAPEMPDVTGAVGTQGCYRMFYGCGQMRTAPSILKATGVGASGYYQMFYNCAWITVAPSISATTIGNSGCYEMFRGCSRLETPPLSLPATTLQKQAYFKMFYQCTALTDIPNFPHDPNGTYVLADGTSGKGNEDGLCFQMFYRCNGLTSLTGKQLFNSSTTLGKFCFQDMFSECSNLATVPPDFLPATVLKEGCYRGMFQSTAITTAPDLPAGTLEKDCYRYMFYNCQSLNYIKCLTTTDVSVKVGSDYKYTNNWVGACVASGTFVRNANNTTWIVGANGIPSGWTVDPPLTP